MSTLLSAAYSLPTYLNHNFSAKISSSTKEGPSHTRRQFACSVVRTRSATVRASGLNEQKPENDANWDVAWRAFKKQQKKSGLLSGMEQYVSRSPQMSNYPLSEEVDPLRRTEKVALDVWTHPKFTYAGFGVIMGLFVFMAVIVGPPPA